MCAGGDFCCPSREEGGAGLRASDQLQQSYATLRGRKYTDKSCGRGVGDNYGRNSLATNFLDDARSVHSLADDFFLPAGAGRAGQHSQPHAKSISRSTDKSLDSLGLTEEVTTLARYKSMGRIFVWLKAIPP